MNKYICNGARSITLQHAIEHVGTQHLVLIGNQWLLGGGANMARGPLAPIASLDCFGVGYQKLRCHKTVPDKLSDAKFDSKENLYSLNKHDASKLGMGSNGP